MGQNESATVSMSKVKVGSFSVSLDGFGAGPRRDLGNPLGVRGLELHTWFLKTDVFCRMHHLSGGDQGLDSDFAARSFKDAGAWILGRNMLGPVRGPWLDDSWKGWSYHVPVFVLTHHARAPLPMKGGTTFCVVTYGPKSTLMQAQEAANGRDVRIGGGVSTIRQFPMAGLIDEVQLAFSRLLLGEGENLFAGIHLPKLGFEPVQTTAGERATHVILRRTDQGETNAGQK